MYVKAGHLLSHVEKLMVQNKNTVKINGVIQFDSSTSSFIVIREFHKVYFFFLYLCMPVLPSLF